VVNAVIDDLEQTRTPETPRQFAVLPFGDDDDDPLPETPSGVRYEPPKGILSSGAGRVGKKKQVKEKMVEDGASRRNRERPQAQPVTIRRSETTMVQPSVTADTRTEDADAQASDEVRNKKRKLAALQDELNKTKKDMEMWAKYLNDDESSGGDKELMYSPNPSRPKWFALTKAVEISSQDQPSKPQIRTHNHSRYSSHPFSPSPSPFQIQFKPTT